MICCTKCTLCVAQVNLALESKSKHTRGKAGQDKQGGGGSGADYKRKNGQTGRSFSADNPYGKRDANDKRQFVRS